MKRGVAALIPTLALIVVVVIACNLPQLRAMTVVATPTITASTTPSPVPTLVPVTPTPMASPSPTVTYTPSPTLTPTATLMPTVTPFALDTHPEWKRYIYVDQMAQRMYIFENGMLTRTILCSTGLPNDLQKTPAWQGKVGWFVGTFFSFEVYADEAWFLFNDGFLIHSLPYLVDKNGNKVYQDRDALGVRPSSHGCIRVSPEDAVWLSAWNPTGVPITISDPYLTYWRAKLKL
jgi:lipoprotein-anchoring transpeptidase ErfK/SrfK